MSLLRIKYKRVRGHWSFVENEQKKNDETNETYTDINVTECILYMSSFMTTKSGTLSFD